MNNWGAYAVLRRTAGAWKLSATGAGNRVSGCGVVKATPTTKAFLVCRDAYYVTGHGEWSLPRVALEGNELASKRLLSVCDESAREACHPGASAEWFDGLDEKVIDRTNDGRPDVVVRLRVGRFVVPEKKECSEEEASHAEKDSGRAETAVLVFENTGSTLQLTAASAS